jgi:hypothetical protein
MRAVSRSIVVLLTIGGFAAPASGVAHAATTTADIGVYAQPNVRSAHVGDRVFFTAIGYNAGPDDIVNDSLDTSYSNPTGVTVRRERCLGGISPDTPFCEFGEVFAGGFTVTQIKTTIEGSNPHGFATLRFCVSNEAGTLEGNDPANDCMAARVRVLV